MSACICVEVNQLERSTLAALYWQKRNFTSIYKHLQLCEAIASVGLVNFLYCLRQMEEKGYVVSIAVGEPQWTPASSQFYSSFGKGHPTRYYKLTELGYSLYLQEIGRVEDLRGVTQ